MTLLLVLFIPVFYFRNIQPDEALRSIFVRIFIAIEFSFLSLFFYYCLKQRVLKKLILVFIAAFLVFSIYDYVISDRSKLGYSPLVAECFVFLVYIIYFFFEKIQSATVIPIYQFNAFWISVAFIIYCSGNFFLFLYSNTPVKDSHFQDQYTLIYSTFTILKDILLCIAVVIKQPDENINSKDFITHNDFLDINIHQENI